MEPYFRAGARLKPYVFQVGDLKVLDDTGERGWVDKQTGVACGFRVGADGIERCLPTEAAGEFFSDARCSNPVVLGPKPSSGQTTVRYLTKDGSSGCSEHAYRVGASLPGTGPVYYVNNTGTCAKFVDRVQNGDVIYRLEEVPLETFVAVKRVPRPRASQMDALVREGEDGSSEVVGFIDPVRQQPCFSLGLNVSPPLCVPGWQRTQDAFDSSSCATPVGWDESASTCPTRPNSALLKVDQPDLSCADQSIAAVWAIAGTVRTPVFVRENGICSLNGGSADPAEVLLAGAPIQLASLPKLEVIDVGTGPLRVRFHGFGGVPFLPASRRFEYLDKTGPFLEAATGEWCEPHPFSDGQWRCVPSSFEEVMDFHLLFASPDCTGARLFASSSFPSCSAKGREPRGVVVKTLVGAVPGYDQIVGTFGVTGKVSPSIVSTGPPASSCRAMSTNGGSYYEANKDLTPADFFSSFERKLSD
jgi:hypothetical protein